MVALWILWIDEKERRKGRERGVKYALVALWILWIDEKESWKGIERGE